MKSQYHWTRCEVCNRMATVKDDLGRDLCLGCHTFEQTVMYSQTWMEMEAAEDEALECDCNGANRDVCPVCAKAGSIPLEEVF